MSQANSARTDRLWTPALLLTLAVGMLHIYFLFRTNINWDEFRFLSEIYEFKRGSDSAGLNNFHVLLYGWLKLLPLNEINQILVARMFQLGLFFASMFVLFRFARSLYTPIVALTCTFLAMCYSSVLLHASSFRFDTLCLFFSLASLYLLWTGARTRTAFLAGAMLAISVLVSVKTILWAPTFAIMGLVLLIYSNDRAQATRRLVQFFLAFLIALLLLFGLHWLLSQPAGTDNNAQGQSLSETISWLWYAMFVMDGLFPRMTYIIRGVTENPVHWLLIAVGAIVAIYRLVLVRGNRRRALIALAMSLPFFSIIFYRNSFPYFYVYILPPAMLLCATAITTMANRFRHANGEVNNLVYALPVLFGVATSSLFLFFHEEGITKQRQVNEVVHELFPEPVHYIGGHGMISSFPRIGPFMSTLGMIRYHAEGDPIFANAIREHQPKMLLVNHMAFYSSDDNLAEDPRQVTLLPDDKAAIHDNYIHHWGPIYVAGKLFQIGQGEHSVSFEIVIPGEYGVESESPVQIDGRVYEHGDVINLSKGIHNLTASNTEQVALRWGGHLPHPQFMAPLEWLYDGL